MNIFLKLKHWQVFLIWIFGLIQLLFFMKYDFWFISFAIYFGLIYMWIYSIGRILNKNNPQLISSMNIWWILFILSLVPVALTFHNNVVGEFSYLINSWIIAITGIIGFLAMIKIVIYTAKTIKRTEFNKEFETLNIVSEIFLIYFLVIGIWVLQPRLNKIMIKKES